MDNISCVKCANSAVASLILVSFKKILRDEFQKT